MNGRLICRWLRRPLLIMIMGSVATVAWGLEDDGGMDPSPFMARFDQNGDDLISADEFPGPEDRFAQMDEDGNGFLDESELPSGPPPGPMDPESMLTDWDTDEDGQISVTEFPGPSDHFDELDADGNGVLDPSELADGRPAPPMGDGFEDDDTDGDGLVSLAEFSGPTDHFDQMDVDGDGYISRTEARPAHR